MADESGYEKQSAEALKRIADALEGINSKLEKVVQKRVHSGMTGPNAEYWVVLTESHDLIQKR